MAAIRQPPQTHPHPQVPILRRVSPPTIPNLDRRRCACASATRLLASPQDLRGLARLPRRACPRSFDRKSEAGGNGGAPLHLRPIGFPDESVQELRCKVGAVRPGQRLFYTKRGKIGRVQQGLEHFSLQLRYEIHLAFETIIKLQPHPMVSAIARFDDMYKHRTTPVVEWV